MASSIQQGYDEVRFVSRVDQNFVCSICSNVLRDAVMCPRNNDCYCRGCITTYLRNRNYQRCPQCDDDLTVQTLAEPQRMVKQMLNELNIRCIYDERGCQEIVQLQHLDKHEATCGFTPAMCKNPGCGATLNQRDLLHHESEICEFRKLKCQSCEEMTKTLTNMEKRIEKVEKNMASNLAAMETHMKNIQSMATNAKNMEENTAKELKTVDDKVTGVKTALTKAFNEMKDVLAKVEDKIENTKLTKARNTPSGDGEKIIVAGGLENASVEMFNWGEKTWSTLQSMPGKHRGATSFVHNNNVTVAGGDCSGYVDYMIRMNIHPNPLAMRWSRGRVKLPTRLTNHGSVLYNDHLMVCGGYNGNGTSNCIHEVQLVPPYTVKTLSRMPEPRQWPGMEIFDSNLLIVGGSKTGRYQESLSSVVQYDITKNERRQLAPLPYEVSEMATVRWGDNIVTIGGVDKRGNALDTVIIYNVKTQKHHMLPAMRCKRRACAAVVTGNNIVVLGGLNERGQEMKSVENFNFESYSWEKLPAMSEGRCYHTAVVV